MNVANCYCHAHYILDASSLINFYGSGYLSKIFRESPVQFSVSRFVAQHEARTVLAAPDYHGRRDCIPIDLRNVISEGLLAITENDSTAVASNVVNLGHSGIRGMGEKISAAVAMVNDWGIVLDDKRATVKLERLLPHIQMLTTFDVVRLWAQRNGVCNSMLREVLCNIRIRGNYHIAKDHPLFNWVKNHGG